MSYEEIVGWCIHKQSSAMAMDGISYDPENYHWELSHLVVDELLRGLNAECLGAMDELFGIRVKVLPVDDFIIQLFKEVK
jgi:hypothetical protein